MKKSEEAYKSIGEVAKILNLINKKNGSPSTHTIRFWEKEFKSIKPRILAGRRRYYDNTTIETLRKIKFLLKNQGMTIKGAKKVLSESTSFNLDDLSNKSITVTADFTALPEKIIPYLIKTECFCFTEQTLKPGESQLFTMVFFLDPSLDSDKELNDITDLVFTYKLSEYKS